MNLATNKTIPIIDLGIHYENLRDEINDAVNKSLKSTQYILGPNVEAFEKELSDFLECSYVISCANGTDALVLALKALDIKTGDEVITVSNSYFATSEAIALVGATPVFIDINEDDFNIATSKIEEAITSKTRAIIPVHLYGQPCDIDKIIEIAKKHNLYVIEDTAQAIGAKYKNKNVGTFGDIGTTSFYPTKNLGACGDGGALFTNHKNIAEKLKLLRHHGSPKRYVHDCIGLNSRLDDIQAAILRVKLKYLEKWNKARLTVANHYNELFKDIKEVCTPVIKPNRTHVFHQYTIKVKSRDLVHEKLKEKGVTTIIYYPIPIHEQKAFSYLTERNKHPLLITKKITKEILSLPMYPELKKEDQEYILNCMKEIFK